MNVNLDQLTQQLSELKQEVKEREAAFKEEISTIKEQRDQLQAQLIEAMGEMGLKSIKNDLGNFAVTARHGYKFTNEVEAMKWARENNAISIDRRLAAQKLKDLEELPEFVEAVETHELRFTPTKE